MHNWVCFSLLRSLRSRRIKGEEKEKEFPSSNSLPPSPPLCTPVRLYMLPVVALRGPHVALRASRFHRQGYINPGVSTA